jgi:Asp-tRNA(Asn)/Glu-tRNA(Gln) amidotransferase A subunit family amidase
MEMEGSPIEKLVGALESEAADPVTIAAEALSKVNGNAGRNSYITVDTAWTRDQARSLSSRFPPKERPALFGLPIALKDCFDLKGFVTSAGSHFYARHNPPAAVDSWVAARLKAAGAIITGKTHMQQLAYGITGENRDYADCVQPVDATSLTGGSSSGSAAAIQEGSAIAAIGTDTGGSIRVPAALCGLTGYRSSLGTGNWRGGAHLAPSFDTIGWLCRDLRDLPRLARALFDLQIPETALPQVRVAYLTGDVVGDCDPSVMECMEQWKERLARVGGQLQSVRADFWKGSYELYAPLQAFEAAKLHAGFFDEFEPAIADRLRWGASLKDEEMAELKARHRILVEQTAAIFAQADFLLMPALPLPRLAAGADHSAARPKILSYTTPASLSGLPAVVLPGKATGMQLLAARGDDVRLLQMAAVLGKAFANQEA